ncbi:pyridoxal-phosphate dependent enzyme [Streptomyces sp. A7024]|uniref:threonine ammonia-lyase n=1 Tax=Streptomyces coryli TaxID=1128680 RepID=A0A6G4U1K9_9ACTN|nr:pyridoxal-phosphate dependent enzyme [Streptomyces coryli]NGN65121.1 pyridoxal-phosphate dependent enzyme [Streptomyces coryli]
MQPPTITDVLEARTLLRRHLPPTPAWSYPTLDHGPAASLTVKHENVQPTGAFKVRGGLTLLAGMEPGERARGVVGYSTGNHAQSLAYAAAQFGVPCAIVMPRDPNPGKARAVTALGAELVEYGANFDEARPYAEKLASERGMRLVSAANEPAILAGVGTAYFELFEDAPRTDTVIVPVGSGSGAAAACIVAAALAPHAEVVAVQSAEAPAAHDSWRAGEIVERPNRTAVEGLATGSGFALPQLVLKQRLKDFLLLDDAVIEQARQILARDAHTLAEGAGAAALAALHTYPDRFAGRRVAVMCTGGNV